MCSNKKCFFRVGWRKHAQVLFYWIAWCCDSKPVLCGLPESACLRLHGASPLPCSSASQRSLQARNAVEWWAWKGERTAACEPARSPARAPVTAPMITLRRQSLHAGHKIIVLRLLHIITLLLFYYYFITSSLLFHYYNITTLSLLHITWQLLVYY